MSNPFRTTTDVAEDGTVTVTVDNAVMTDTRYCTVVVSASTGFERNAVAVSSDADDTLVLVNGTGVGMMLDAYARGLAEALRAYYARKDGAE